MNLSRWSPVVLTTLYLSYWPFPSWQSVINYHKFPQLGCKVVKDLNLADRVWLSKCTNSTLEHRKISTSCPGTQPSLQSINLSLKTRQPWTQALESNNLAKSWIQSLKGLRFPLQSKTLQIPEASTNLASRQGWWRWWDCSLATCVSIWAAINSSERRTW